MLGDFAGKTTKKQRQHPTNSRRECLPERMVYQRPAKYFSADLEPILKV